jgi:UDP-glucuronate decarboxylase
LPQDDLEQRCPDIGKAKLVLDWEPRIAIADGLKRTIDYFTSLVDAGAPVPARSTSR